MKKFNHKHLKNNLWLELLAALIGALLIAVALLADLLGTGGQTGFGIKQMILSVLGSGLLLAAIMGLIVRRYGWEPKIPTLTEIKMEWNKIQSVPDYPLPWQIPAAQRRSVRVALLLWGLLRLPALAMVLYLFRNLVISTIERLFDIAGITVFVLALVSTPIARGVIFLSFILMLLAFWMLVTQRFGPVTAYISTVIATCILLTVSFRVAGMSSLYALPPVLILVTNLIPDQIIGRFSRLGRLWLRFIAAGIAVIELFFFRQYVEWLRSLLGSQEMPRRASASILSVLPGLILTSGVLAVTLNYEPLVPLEQALRMSPDASIIDTGDFNWIELDGSGQYLYVTGFGAQHLRRYDLAHLADPPLLSGVPSGWAQAFAYDPDADEIYVYNAQTKHLLYLDAVTLDLKRSLDLPEVAPGDSWIAVDRQSDTIAVISEADIQTGTPFIVLNRSTGAVLDQRNLNVGNILPHPDKSIVYLSSFRRTTSLIAYDLEQREVLHETSTDPRVHRMAYWKQGNELLLASSLESRVLRFDADTLEPKGNMDAVFGVRVVAVDPLRNLLLGSSIATGTVAVYDLTTGQQQASFYLGPWLRTIALDPNNSIAYVSANGALYKLNYGHLR